MGGSNTKDTREQLRILNLSANELARLQDLYKTACENQSGMTGNDFRCVCEGMIDECLLGLLVGYLLKGKNTIDFKSFVYPYATAERGSPYERAQYIFALLTGDPSASDIPRQVILDYVGKIFVSYLLQLDTSKNKELLSWKVEHFKIEDENVKLFTDHLCCQLTADPIITFDLFEEWICSSSRLGGLEKYVYRKLYQVADEFDEGGDIKFVPLCVMRYRKRSRTGISPSVLDITNVISLNSSLPIELRNQWTLLFSCITHGMSFSKLMEQIVDKGPTIIIIEDTEGTVFGGFATDSWKLGPNFYGNERSFLFTLKPQVNLYFASGYNNHFQYMNIQQQTYPNGLGMGGQFEYFGFWLDAEFGKGHSSETCTTYKPFKRLSSSKEFCVHHLEVWGLGPETKKSAEELHKRKGVLDADNAGRALLEMVGKSYNSDAYREPADDTD